MTILLSFIPKGYNTEKLHMQQAQNYNILLKVTLQYLINVEKKAVTITSKMNGYTT